MKFATADLTNRCDVVVYLCFFCRIFVLVVNLDGKRNLSTYRCCFMKITICQSASQVGGAMP